jgi:GNAT superfamily N-acetyltransferase
VEGSTVTGQGRRRAGRRPPESFATRPGAEGTRELPRSKPGGGPTVTIERAQATEVRRIASLFDAYRRFYQRPSDLKRARAFLTTRLRRRESVVFVARAGTRRLGFMQLYPTFSSESLQPIWILNDLFVVPKARRQGVGTSLLERAQKFAEETGAGALLLETATHNPARKLYERLGWQRDRGFVHYQWVRKPR